jgi:hypothetical protein
MAADEPRQGDLDGRGNLSRATLIAFSIRCSKRKGKAGSQKVRTGSCEQRWSTAKCRVVMYLRSSRQVSERVSVLRSRSLRMATCEAKVTRVS